MWESNLSKVKTESIKAAPSSVKMEKRTRTCRTFTILLMIKMFTVYNYVTYIHSYLYIYHWGLWWLQAIIIIDSYYSHGQMESENEMPKAMDLDSHNHTSIYIFILNYICVLCTQQCDTNRCLIVSDVALFWQNVRTDQENPQGIAKWELNYYYYEWS